ncbi:hypothetical protein DIE18_36935 [Burkholderia sp. Bp9125]|nr:hypothetical protein DIE18_36935 [Burkholderia sp. Bp9125]
MRFVQPTDDIPEADHRVKHVEAHFPYFAQYEKVRFHLLQGLLGNFGRPATNSDLLEDQGSLPTQVAVALKESVAGFNFQTDRDGKELSLHGKLLLRE